MFTIELWAFSTSTANKTAYTLFKNELVFVVLRTPLNAFVHSLLRRGGGREREKEGEREREREREGDRKKG